jgi:hypothetical protein
LIDYQQKNGEMKIYRKKGNCKKVIGQSTEDLRLRPCGENGEVIACPDSFGRELKTTKTLKINKLTKNKKLSGKWGIEQPAV